MVATTTTTESNRICGRLFMLLSHMHSRWRQKTEREKWYSRVCTMVKAEEINSSLSKLCVRLFPRNHFFLFIYYICSKCSLSFESLCGEKKKEQELLQESEGKKNVFSWGSNSEHVKIMKNDSLQRAPNAQCWKDKRVFWQPWIKKRKWDGNTQTHKHTHTEKKNIHN